MTRLLTLTGAGGSGKTRLALEVARGLLDTYPDGVWLVELAPLSEPALVPWAVGEALGIREQPRRPLTATLTESLRTRDLLLILDNCEHVIGGCADLVDALSSSCERVRMLATSREPLGVEGEVSWLVSPLALPDTQRSPRVEDLSSSEAVRLFVERARSRLPGFELTPENAGSVADVCRRLAGIPLAIELATARMGMLAVHQIAERLEDSLRLLTGGGRTAEPRQRTLGAALDWSYGLLSGPERALFSRLSVFTGGWTLEAAKGVGASAYAEDGDVPDLLGKLVNKSMVVEASRGTTQRYAMLEPVRQYGLERLEESGEVDAVRRRHAFWFFDLAREVEPWLRGARRQAWLERLEMEYGNLRAALGWALESGEADLGLWFGGALGEFWYLSGNLSEGRRWLEAALANSADAQPTPARTRALARAGWIAWEQGDYGRSVALSEESLALARRLEARQAPSPRSPTWAGRLCWRTSSSGHRRWPKRRLPSRALSTTREASAARS